MFVKSLVRRLRTFAAETRGSVSIEFVLVMPFLFWAFMAVYVYFDGYRQSAVNLKAAYTIGDLISRETGVISEDYVDAMESLLRTLTRAQSDVSLRISVIRWDDGDGSYYVDWSANRGYGSALNDGDMTNMQSKLPVMPDNERVILIETSNTFVPLFNVGMDNVELDNFVFTRPRFVDQVCWHQMSCAAS